MSSSGVNLHTTDVFNVQIVYDGTNLKMTITDASTNATFTQTWPINIVSTIGANSAYVGFTGGTGGDTAIQDILNWTMTSSVGATAMPTFNPLPGTYNSTQNVTINDTTTGAAIYYTTNNTTPTTSSAKYSAPIPVAATETIQAIAVAPGYTNSPVASGTYTITPPAATPSISPATGTYGLTQTVTITDTTAGATIYYTTNGTQPTSSSAKYAGSFQVSSTTTVKAIATAAGFSTSATATSVITINKTPIVYHTTTLTGVSSGPTLRQFTYSNFPDGVGMAFDATAAGDNVTFTVNVSAAGTYDIQLSYKKYNPRGISQLSINGTNVGGLLDQYAATDSYAVFDCGKFTFTAAGNYSFKFTVTGKNASSQGYRLSFDDITLTPQ